MTTPTTPSAKNNDGRANVPGSRKSFALRFYWLAALFLACGVLAYIFYVRASLFWDFRIYYSAAYIFRVGQNPYDNELLYSVSVLDGLPYPYPPPTLYFFLPFTYIDWDYVIVLWPLLISLWLALTMRLWKKQFVPEIPAPRFLILCLLAFNLTLPKNMITGNIGALEGLLLWTAFTFLLRSEVTWFVALLGLSALFKMTPMVFLIVPLLHPELRRKWKTVFTGGAVFAAYLFLCYAMRPAWFAQYQQNVSIALKDWELKDFFNSSTYSIARRTLMTLFPSLPEKASVSWAYIFYGTMALVVLVISGKVIRTLAKRKWAEAGVPLILYTTLIYGLLMPRMLDYAFGLMIPAVLYVMEKILPPSRSIYLLVALLLPVPFISFPDFAIPGDFFFGYWGYWNVLMILVSWILFSRHLWASPQSVLPKHGSGVPQR